MDAPRYGHWRFDWQEGQTHWPRMRDDGRATRTRCWSIAEVVTGIFSLDYLLVGLVTLRTGHCHFHGTVATLCPLPIDRASRRETHL